MQQQQKDLRVVNKATLIALCRHGRMYGFNRQMKGAWVDANALDTWHVIELMLFDHHAFDAGLPLHHRVRVWMRDRWGNETRMFTMDIADLDWRIQMTIDEFEDMHEDAQVSA